MEHSAGHTSSRSNAMAASCLSKPANITFTPQLCMSCVSRVVQFKDLLHQQVDEAQTCSELPECCGIIYRGSSQRGMSKTDPDRNTVQIPPPQELSAHPTMAHYPQHIPLSLQNMTRTLQTSGSDTGSMITSPQPDQRAARHAPAPPACRAAGMISSPNTASPGWPSSSLVGMRDTTKPSTSTMLSSPWLARPGSPLKRSLAGEGCDCAPPRDTSSGGNTAEELSALVLRAGVPALHSLQAQLRWHAHWPLVCTPVRTTTARSLVWHGILRPENSILLEAQLKSFVQLLNTRRPPHRRQLC